MFSCSRASSMHARHVDYLGSLSAIDRLQTVLRACIRLQLSHRALLLGGHGTSRSETPPRSSVARAAVRRHLFCTSTRATVMRAMDARALEDSPSRQGLERWSIALLQITVGPARSERSDTLRSASLAENQTAAEFETLPIKMACLGFTLRSRPSQLQCESPARVRNTSTSLAKACARNPA